MNTITIDEQKLDELISQEEAKRDKHPINSAEYIELDQRINWLLKIISNCTIK